MIRILIHKKLLLESSAMINLQKVNSPPFLKIYPFYRKLFYTRRMANSTLESAWKLEIGLGIW